MWLIGQRCKCSNAFSRLILIGRGLDLKYWATSFPNFLPCSVFIVLLLESTIKKYEVSADDREGPPVPISNTEVKLTSAEDTWLATAWENRSVLTPYYIPP